VAASGGNGALSGWRQLSLVCFEQVACLLQLSSIISDNSELLKAAMAWSKPEGVSARAPVKIQVEALEQMLNDNRQGRAQHAGLSTSLK
jgi:hypothetical protein